MANKSFIFRSGDIEVREREFSVVKAGEVLPVEPKAFRVLLVLLRNPQKLIPKEELLNAVWGDAAVTENSLTRSIALLRRLLGDETRSPRYIETVATVGYRFVCKVEVSEDAAGNVEVIRRDLDPAPPVGEVAEQGARSGGQTDGRRNRLRSRLLVGVPILVVGLATAVWFLRPALPPPTVTGSTTQLTQDGVTKSFPWGTLPMFTEGSRIYFQEVAPNYPWPLMQVSTEGGETASIDIPLMYFHLEGISPNGLELLFSSEPGVGDSLPLWRLPLPGLQPHRIGNLIADSGTPAWSRDGSVIYYGSHSDIFAADADGSHPRKLLTTAGNPVWLRVSPDGNLLRFSVRDAQFAKSSLWEAHSDGSGLRQLLPGFNNAANVCCGNWTADGKYFVFQSTSGRVSTLWAMRETGDRWRKVRREPVQLTLGEIDAESPLPSKDGKKIFFIGAKRRGEVMRYDLKTHSIAPYLPGFSAQWLSFSRDGQRMAFVSYPQGILWQSKTDGTDRHQLTFPPMGASLPRWSPDGSLIAFGAGMPGKPSQVFLISAGGGVLEQLTSGDAANGDATWSADGDSLAYAGPLASEPTKIALHIINLKTRQVTVVPDSAGLYSPRWSPDGRYLLALPMENRRLMLFDFNHRSWQQLTQGKVEGGYPSWTPDGKCVYFNSTGEKGSPEYRICLSDREIQHVADMAQAGSLLDGGGGCWTGLAPDGSILGMRDTSTEEIYALDVKLP